MTRRDTSEGRPGTPFATRFLESPAPGQAGGLVSGSPRGFPS